MEQMEDRIKKLGLFPGDIARYHQGVGPRLTTAQQIREMRRETRPEAKTPEKRYVKHKQLPQANI
jgi:hypothetical protein